MIDSANEDYGNFLKIFLTGDRTLCVKEEYLKPVKDSVAFYADNGKDYLLAMEDAYGVTIYILASRISAFFVSTPDLRKRFAQDDARFDAWDLKVRDEAVPEWEL